MKQTNLGFAVTALFFCFSIMLANNAASSEITLGDFGKVSDDLAVVCVNNIGCVLVDKAGNAVSTLKYHYLYPDEYFYPEDASEGLIKFKSKHKTGYIDAAGKQVIAPQFEEAYPFSEGFARVKIKGKWGAIDKTGKQVIAPQFEGMGSFKDGLVSVKINGKYGYVDATGKIQIAPQFEDADQFGEGIAYVEIDGKWGAIDKTGAMIISPKFDWLSSFQEGMGKIAVGKKVGYVDKAGNVVIPPQFELAGIFSEGLAPVSGIGKLGFRFGYIDKKGTQVIEPQFNDAQEFSKGLARVMYKGEVGYINHQGEWAISPETLSETLAKYVSQGKEASLASKKNEVVSFRKTLGEGVETNCGPVIEVKAKLVKVSFAVANYGNEHWIRRDEIFPSGYGCSFTNGQYQLPEK